MGDGDTASILKAHAEVPVTRYPEHITFAKGPKRTFSYHDLFLFPIHADELGHIRCNHEDRRNAHRDAQCATERTRWIDKL